MIIDKPKTGKFPLAPEGEQVATLMAVKDLGELDNPFAPGEQAHYARLVWKAQGNTRVSQRVKVSLHPASRLYDIATQLLQAVPPEKLNTDDLVGKSAYIVVTHSTSEDGTVWANVKEIRAMAYQGRKAPTPEEAATPVTFGKKRESIMPNTAVDSVSAFYGKPAPAKPEPPIDDSDIPF